MKSKLLSLVVLGSTLALGATTQGCAGQTDAEDTSEGAVSASRPEIALANNATADSIQAKLFTMLKLSGKANMPGVDAAFKLTGKIAVGRSNVGQSAYCWESATRDPGFFLLRACSLKGFNADGTTGGSLQSDSFPAKLYKIMEDLGAAEDIASAQLGIKRSTHTEATEVGNVTYTLSGTGGELACTAGTVGIAAVIQYACSFKKVVAPAFETKTGKLKSIISIGGELGPELIDGASTIELELDALRDRSGFRDGAEALVKGVMGTTMGVEIHGLRPVFKASQMFVCPAAAKTFDCMPPVTGDGGFCAADIRAWAHSKCPTARYVD